MAPRIVTVDMDGTLFDPWSCCGWHDVTFLGSDACRHARQDTLRRLEEVLAANPGAQVAVLSWRQEWALDATLEWLAMHGVKPWAMFLLGSPDTKRLHDELDKRSSTTRSQMTLDPWTDQQTFKAAVVRALRDVGHDVIASFDDDRKVLGAIARLGVPTHRVDPLPKPAADRDGDARWRDDGRWRDVIQGRALEVTEDEPMFVWRFWSVADTTPFGEEPRLVAPILLKWTLQDVAGTLPKGHHPPPEPYPGHEDEYRDLYVWQPGTNRTNDWCCRWMGRTSRGQTFPRDILGRLIYGRGEAHDRPEPWCGCGICGYRYRHTLMASWQEIPAYARIAVWGRVFGDTRVPHVEQPISLRAEYGKIAGPLYLDERTTKHADYFADYYGVEVASGPKILSGAREADVRYELSS